MSWFRGRARVGAIVASVLLILIVGGFELVGGGGGSMRLTAYFPQTIGLYQGNAVKILGVTVGKITKLTNEGSDVKVEMTYDRKYSLPRDVGAAIVPPSIVSGRYVQLLPAYTGGPKASDGEVIPLSRTQIPLELNQIFDNLNQMNKALGPNGANAHGALSKLVNVSAANLKGNGALFNQALGDFSQAISTLSGNRVNLFKTLGNLQQFTTNLAVHNTDVAKLNVDLGKVSTILAGDRSDLNAALTNLAVALGEVRDFVANNRGALVSDVSQLASVTQVLVNRQRDLQEILDDAPLGLQNLALAYDATYHTLDSRGDQENSTAGNNPTNPACYLYSALTKQACPASPLPAPPPLPATGATQQIMSLLGGMP